MSLSLEKNELKINPSQIPGSEESACIILWLTNLISEFQRYVSLKSHNTLDQLSLWVTSSHFPTHIGCDYSVCGMKYKKAMKTFGKTWRGIESLLYYPMLQWQHIIPSGFVSFCDKWGLKKFTSMGHCGKSMRSIWNSYCVCKIGKGGQLPGILEMFKKYVVVIKFLVVLQWQLTRILVLSQELRWILQNQPSHIPLCLFSPPNFAQDRFCGWLIHNNHP